MSTRTPTQTTRPSITENETSGDAPLTFATDDEVPIRGLFDAESDQH